MKVRKKPVVVDAVMFNGKPPTDPEFAGLHIEEQDGDFWIFNSLEDCYVRCPKGHWIIKGVKGEFYPCEPETMQRTYEPVDDEDLI